MIRKISTLLLVLSFLGGWPAHSMEAGISVVVNDQAISNMQVYDRMALIMASSGIPDTPENRERLLPQVRSMLIEEALQWQESRAYDIEVSEQEIDEGIAQIAQQNNFSQEQFEEILKAQGIPRRTLENQVRAQIAWGKLVQQQLRPQIQITENDVKAMRNRLDGTADKKQYLISEIFLPVTNPQENQEVRSLARKLTSEIREGRAPFGAIAQQFSKAPGANKGGIIGWVQEDQLSQELASVVKKLDQGELSAPVRTPEGYHILLLRQIRERREGNVPNREQIVSKLGMERLNRLQARYLQDLKAEAFIDNRG